MRLNNHRWLVVVPYMDSSSVCKHSVFWRKGSTAHVYPVSVSCISARDLDGLSARQLPIGVSGFSAVVILGFCQHWFDLFAITQSALQSWLKCASSYAIPRAFD